jgi:hypothetical protein
VSFGRSVCLCRYVDARGLSGSARILAAKLEQDWSAGLGSFDSDLLADFFGANLSMSRYPELVQVVITLPESVEGLTGDARLKHITFVSTCVHEDQRRPGNVL